MINSVDRSTFPSISGAKWKERPINSPLSEIFPVKKILNQYMSDFTFNRYLV